MGVETPIPPKRITTAAPDGAPPRRIRTVEKNCQISWSGVNRIDSYLILQTCFSIND